MNNRIKLIYLFQQSAFVAVFVAAVWLASTNRPIAAILPAAAAVYGVFGVFDIRLSLFVRVRNRIGVGERKILLTFDDAPTVDTEKILATLEKENIKAVFFIIGRYALEYEATVRRISNAGHTLGIHTQNHSVKTTFSGFRHVEEEIVSCKTVLERISGGEVNLFRPPFGVMNPVIAMAVRKHRLTTVGWSIRSLDTQTGSKNCLIKRVVRRLSPGAIVLLHDIPLTADALPELIAEIRKKGYEFALMGNGGERG